MASSPKDTEQVPDLSEDEVVAYLKAHPEFLVQHPEVLEAVVPPDQQLGDNVSDFQYFAIRRLQEQIHDMRQNYDMLVNSARDNSSVQQQVHRAIVGLIRANGLERLLEVLTVDLMQLFDVDVVRLAMESDFLDLHETHYSEDNYSGIVFIETGTAAEIFGEGDVALVPNTADVFIPGFDAVFSECTRLVTSCALLRLSLQDEPREVILAFGVRHPDWFHPGQGVELLQFLAIIVQERLEVCLREESIMGELPESGQ